MLSCGVERQLIFWRKNEAEVEAELNANLKREQALRQAVLARALPSAVA